MEGGGGGCPGALPRASPGPEPRHTHSQTHPPTQPPAHPGSGQPPARPLVPEGRCKSSHVPSKGSVRVSHSARRGTPSWVFLAPKILASGEPPSARSCTRRYAVPGDQTQVRRSTSPRCSRPCLRGLGDASGGALRPPGPPAPSAQPALGAGGERAAAGRLWCWGRGPRLRSLEVRRGPQPGSAHRWKAPGPWTPAKGLGTGGAAASPPKTPPPRLLLPTHRS